jgi:hypothetical protein
MKPKKMINPRLFVWTPSAWEQAWLTVLMRWLAEGHFEGTMIIGINVSESASVHDKFSRLRDELWWKAR